MILTQFPDLSLVRKLRNEPGRGTQPWMNVALNIHCSQVSRTGVESPYSIFLNKKGFSYCRIGKQDYRVETSTFLFAAPGSQYDLTVDNTDGTEICNIHFNKAFFEGWMHSLTTGSAALLDDHEVPGSVFPGLISQLYPSDAQMAGLISKLTVTEGEEQFEVILSDIIRHMVLCNAEVRARIAALPFIRPTVRADIYRRLALAKDILHSRYTAAVNLDELCRETAMSKFHFLRMFKACYGVTPYNYLVGIRMARAAELLKTGLWHIDTIAAELGFEYPGSFIKAFHKAYGVSPLRYRKQ